ncbi:MAG: hypothetical protein R3C53_03345 [Pirellulaceae bacterium]
MICLGGWLISGLPASAQVPDQSPAEHSVKCHSVEFVDEQLSQLGASDFRARELARWRLEQTPAQSIAGIKRVIHAADYNAAAQMVGILSALAIRTDAEISLSSRQLLNELSQETSSIGRMASNTLGAIADVQEAKAIEILTYHGAYIGPSDFPINGKQRSAENWLSLKIDESFTGDAEVVQWIRYLKSVECVYFLGSKIDTNYYSAIAQLGQLKAIKLKRARLAAADLASFKNLQELEHLGLLYMDIDDSYLPALLELPLSRSMRLYGTQLTQQAEDRLVAQLDGVEIFRGNGGFWAWP